MEVNPKDLERYSLDLSTVELCWWKLKHFLHSKATCTYEALDQAMTGTMDYIIKDNPIGCFAHCDLFA
ncbi:hypothetical protein [Mastigocoleus sp. MO_188.B34]|uniref:hypothetical protein n=1 Tax=Mastigocoleus sp. MO_188.B34 TaxID=3036635 RepID=UPI00261A2889|nr:hypothetical protein [Mastigocoleus sp. MO_188.B34]MDJ0697804.1 hypothetical protein [Mastigocoleus sp. MO_188.B34]